MGGKGGSDLTPDVYAREYPKRGREVGEEAEGPKRPRRMRMEEGAYKETAKRARRDLVDRLVEPRLHAHHLADARVDLDVRAAPVEHVDRRRRAELPRARGEGVRLAGQRAHRAEVDDVARHLWQGERVRG